MIKFPMTVPRRVRWIATYTDSFNVAHGTVEAMAGRVYRLNSIFDPNFSLVAPTAQDSVFGLSVMQGMYDQYRVYFTTVEARWFKRDNLTQAEHVADNPRDWSQGYVLHMEVGTLADRTTPDRSYITDSIQLKSRTGVTGSDTQGLYNPPESQFPEQVRMLMENGAQFPGGVKFRNLPDHVTGGQAGAGNVGTDIPFLGARYNNKKQQFPRIAGSFLMRHLSREPSDTEFRADGTWGATMDSSPTQVRLVGVGWGNSAYVVNTAPGDRPICGGYMQVKIKYYCILSAKEAVEGFTVDPEP